MRGLQHRGWWRMLGLTALASVAGLGLVAAPVQAVPLLPAPPLDPTLVAAQVGPAVVNIDTHMSYQSATGSGTGIVLDPGGVVLTNNHVIAGATNITAVVIGNGQSYDADVVGFDRNHDVAILQLRGAGNLPTANIGSSARVNVGDPVVALGNTGGQGGAPDSLPGHITALNQSVTASDSLTGSSETLTNMIKSDTPIRPGDSGGPLVNSAGQVVGMNTAASESFQFGGDGFAIPIDQAMAIANQIRAGIGSNAVHIGPTGFLGVGVADTNGTAEVLQVIPDTPAAQVGINEHDVIIAVNGSPVNSPTDLTNLLDQRYPGDNVSVSWHSPETGAHTATVTLVPGPAG